jgi:hypothetical protein
MQPPWGGPGDVVGESRASGQTGGGSLYNLRDLAVSGLVLSDEMSFSARHP